MENFNQLIKAINNKRPLVWNDPCPIEGNDYTITKIENIENLLKDFDESEWEDIYDDLIILIQYGGGSEAEIFLTEIGFK